MEVLTPDFVEDLFRVAVLQTGERELALQLVSAALVEAEARSAQWRTLQQRFLWAVHFICERWRKKSTPPALLDGNLPVAFSEVVGSFQSIRPALLAPLVLHLVGDAKQAEILHLFRIRTKEWRAALVQWESNLAMRGLDQEEARRRVRALCLHDTERLGLERTVSEIVVRPAGSDRVLAVAAVLLGAAVLVGWLGWERWRESVPVRMRSQLEGLLQTSQEAGSNGFEVFQGPARETADWLFLHGMESIQIPPSFAGLELDGGRMLSWNGGRVALFLVKAPPGFLVVADARLVGLNPEEPEPGRTQFGEWWGAWELSGTSAVLFVAKADRSAFEAAMVAKPAASP